MAAELPGMKAVELAIAAPADIMGLATRQMTETITTLNTGMTRTVDALELPGLPPIAQMLPMGIGSPNAVATPTKRITEAPVRRTVRSIPYGED